MGREHSDHLAAREAGTHQRTADRTACSVSQGTDRPHQEPESHQQEGRQERQGIICKTHNKKNVKAYEEFETTCFAVLQIGDGNVRGGMVLPAREYGRDMQPYLSSFPFVEDDSIGSTEHQTGIGLCRPSRTGGQLHAGTGQGMGYRAQGGVPSVGGFLGTRANPC